jgi:hypothetical protein
MAAIIRWKSDFRVLARIENEIMKVADDTAKDTAEAIVQDIKSSWSNTSPAPQGSPPAVVEGNLDRGIQVVEGSRNEFGQFAGKAGRYRYVTADTLAGDWQGRRDPRAYARAVEDPLNSPWGNRPYLAPAVERAGITITDIFKENFRRRTG